MDEVHLVNYDPRWPQMYADEVARLRNVLPNELICAIEHFGSTAVPGLAAKPIIDIVVAVRSLAKARAIAVTPLASLGYTFWADNPKQDRLFFVKGLPPAGPGRTDHVHMTEFGGDIWKRLSFRDYLRAHPDEAARYSSLKTELASRHHYDREAYTAAKTTYVEAVMAKIAAEEVG